MEANPNQLNFGRPLVNLITGGDKLVGVPGPAADGPDSAAALAREAEAAAEQAQRVEQLLEALVELLTHVETCRQQSLEELQLVAVDLAVTIASHILYEKIDAEEFAIDKLVEAGIRRMGLDAPVTVLVHPDDLELLQARAAAHADSILNNSVVRLATDASLDRGGCEVEAGGGAIVTTPNATLSELYQLLLESMEDAQVERRKGQGSDQRLRRFPDRRETA